jgi:N-acetylneuraminic acid mutarotase
VRRALVVLIVILATILPGAATASGTDWTSGSTAKAPSTGELSWATKASMLTPRSGPGLVATPDGKIYAIGGDNDTFNDPVLFTLSSVEVYDVKRNTWSPRASMPTNRAWLGAAVGKNGKIYAIGGAPCQNCPGLTTVEEYDPKKNQWTTKASMPTGRQGLAVVSVGGRIYAIGGYDSGTYFTTVEEYDPATDTWRSRASMNYARQHFGVVVGDNGRLYAIGHAAAVEEYDPSTNTWRVVSSLPTPRWALGVAKGPNGRIYAIGGNNGAMLNLVEEYDPVANTWATKTSMLTARQGVVAATASNGRIYAVGGEASASGNLATVEEATIR